MGIRRKLNVDTLLSLSIFLWPYFVIVAVVAVAVAAAVVAVVVVVVFWWIGCRLIFSLSAGNL